MRSAIEKLATDKQTREELTQILIHQQELDKRAAAEKWVKDFENTYNQLSDKNKEHLKNGLGENLIQTEEQANAVLGVMKMMNAFDSLGL